MVAGGGCALGCALVRDGPHVQEASDDTHRVNMQQDKRRMMNSCRPPNQARLLKTTQNLSSALSPFWTMHLLRDAVVPSRWGSHYAVAMQPESFSPTQRSSDFVGPFFFTRFRFKLPHYPYIVPGFPVFGPDGTACLYVKHAPPRRKTEFVLYADDSESQPLITLRTRRGVRNNAPIEAFDMLGQEMLAVFKKQGLRSIVQNAWDVFDGIGTRLGRMIEEGVPMLRRLSASRSVTYHIEQHGQDVATVVKDVSGHVPEFVLDLTTSVGKLDSRVALCCGILVVAAESQRDIVGGEYRVS